MAKYDFEALKAKVDIVKVISHYIDVTKKGNGYAALCPFHNDSNPSPVSYTHLTLPTNREV